MVLWLALPPAFAAGQPPAASQCNPLPPGVDPRSGPMVCVPAGTFEMGSPEWFGDMDEQPRHLVRLNAFYIDRYEVSAEQYRRFAKATHRKLPKEMENKPGYYPAVSVSWAEAAAYCTWAGKRLPTEAEWEKAAQSDLLPGKRKFSRVTPAAEYIWYEHDQRKAIRPVGEEMPNALGIFGMHNYVWEWCSDWYSDSYYRDSPMDNPQGPPAGDLHVARGGGWYYWSGVYVSRITARGRPWPNPLIAGIRCAK